MSNTISLHERLRVFGISRRALLKFCATTASMLALPPGIAPVMAKALESARRPSVIWLSFQECTGCTESLTRASSPSIEQMIFNHVSLDYHHTLQAAAGEAAETARQQAMTENHGKYLLLVDGSIPVKDGGIYSTIAGVTNEQMLYEVAEGAAAIVAIGSCAAFGGLPMANPNPTGAVPVSELIKDKPIMNVPGCPPIPTVMTGALVHFLTFGTLPELDDLGRPKAYFGERIHDRCYRRPYYDKGLFAESFDDEGAKKGWCLYRLGCKGPTTYNACATTKWNDGVSFPIEAGHPCLGCSEPRFWDGGSFYRPTSAPTGSVGLASAGGIAAGLAVGAATGLVNSARKRKAKDAHEKVTVDKLEEKS
jgi:hydrogenase small subunit